MLLIEEKDSFDFKSMQRMLARTFHDVHQRDTREESLGSNRKRSFGAFSEQESCSKRGRVDVVTAPHFDESQEQDEGDDFIKKEYPFAQKKHLNGDFFYTFSEMKASYDRVLDFCFDRKGEIFQDKARSGKLEFHSTFKLHSFGPFLEIRFCILMHPLTDDVLCATTFLSGDYLQYRRTINDLMTYMTDSEEP